MRFLCLLGWLLHVCCAELDPKKLGLLVGLKMVE